jgi:hypothetical protein
MASGKNPMYFFKFTDNSRLSHLILLVEFEDVMMIIQQGQYNRAARMMQWDFVTKK